MLPKKNKLPIQLFKKRANKIFRSDSFDLKVFQRPESDSLAETRMGIIIGNKVFKKATKRNSLRRSVFSHFQELITRLSVADYLLIAKPNASKLNKTEVKKEIKNLFKNL